MTLTARELRAAGVDELVIKVRTIRRKLHLTIDECAAMLRMPYRTLQDLELGVRPPSRKQRIQLQQLYNRWHRIAAKFGRSKKGHDPR